MPMDVHSAVKRLTACGVQDVVVDQSDRGLVIVDAGGSRSITIPGDGDGKVFRFAVQLGALNGVKALRTLDGDLFGVTVKGPLRRIAGALPTAVVVDGLDGDTVGSIDINPKAWAALQAIARKPDRRFSNRIALWCDGSCLIAGATDEGNLLAVRCGKTDVPIDAILSVHDMAILSPFRAGLVVQARDLVFANGSGFTSCAVHGNTRVFGAVAGRILAAKTSAIDITYEACRALAGMDSLVVVGIDADGATFEDTKTVLTCAGSMPAMPRRAYPGIALTAMLRTVKRGDRVTMRVSSERDLDVLHIRNATAGWDYALSPYWFPSAPRVDVADVPADQQGAELRAILSIPSHNKWRVQL